jgi:hypothetical protein
MPGEGIDKSQAAIRQHIDTAEGKHKEAKDDKAAYQQYRNSFISAVDDYQSLENNPDYGIKTSSAARSHFEAGLTKVHGVLVEAASQGAGLSKEITDTSRQSSIDRLNSLSGDVLHDMNSYRKPLLKIVEVEASYNTLETNMDAAKREVSGGMINLLNIPTSYFDTLVQGLNACKSTTDLINGSAGELPAEYVNERRESIKTATEYIANMLKFQALHSTIKNNQYGNYVEVVIKNTKTGEKKVNVTDEFKTLPAEKQQEILNDLALSDIQMDAAIENSTAPEELNS